MFSLSVITVSFPIMVSMDIMVLLTFIKIMSLILSSPESTFHTLSEVFEHDHRKLKGGSSIYKHFWGLFVFITVFIWLSVIIVDTYMIGVTTFVTTIVCVVRLYRS